MRRNSCAAGALLWLQRCVFGTVESLFSLTTAAQNIAFCVKNHHCAEITFGVVENRVFADHLRNDHLGKSAVMGIRCLRYSPMTAKLPFKVYLRLRFQNFGKPRTAGLCGQAAAKGDCGPLSCYIFERGYHPANHLQNCYQRSRER